MVGEVAHAMKVLTAMKVLSAMKVLTLSIYASLANGLCAVTTCPPSARVSVRVSGANLCGLVPRVAEWF